jgi:hypothetical protein
MSGNLFAGLLPDRRRLHRLAERLGLERQPGDRLEGAVRGHSVSIDYQPRARGEPPALSLSVPRTLPLRESVRFRRKGVLHRVVRAVGLTREVPSGDESFDRAVFCASEDDSPLAPLVADTGVRAAVRRLLDSPGARVDLTARGASVRYVWRPGWGARFRASHVERAVEELAELTYRADRVLDRSPPEGLTEEHPTHPMREQPVWIKWPLMGFAFSLVLGPATMWWGSRYPTCSWRLQLIGAGIAVPLLLLGMALAYAALRGRSTSHSDFGFLLLAGAIGLPSLGAGTLAVVNGVFDRGAPAATPAQWQAVPGRNRLELRFAAPGCPTTAHIGRGRAPAERESVYVLVQPGALGEPWIGGIEYGPPH